MTEAVHKTGSAVLIDTYAQKTALRLGVSAESMRQEFKKTSRSAPSAKEESARRAGGGNDPALSREAGLLRVLLENDSFVEWTAAHLDLEWLAHPVVREIVAGRLSLEANPIVAGRGGLAFRNGKRGLEESDHRTSG